jgi:hypothetical protein
MPAAGEFIGGRQGFADITVTVYVMPLLDTEVAPEIYRE